MRDLKSALNDLIDQKLAEAVREKRSQYLEEVIELLQRLQTRLQVTDDQSKVLEVMTDTLQNIRGIIEEHKETTIADVYLTAVKKHTFELEKDISVSQSESRFKKLEQDAANVRFIKSLKRTARSLGSISRDFSNILRKLLNKPTRAYEPWRQQIPYQHVTEYHLYKADELLKRRVDGDYRHVTDIILELENYLAENYYESDISGGEPEVVPAPSFDERVNELLQGTKKYRNDLDRQVEEDFDTIRENLLHYLERVGTMERRSGFYQESRVEKRASRFRDVLDNALEEWNEANLQLLDKTETVKEFVGFQKELDEQGMDFIDSLATFFDSYLKKPIKSLQNDLQGIQSSIQTYRDKQNKEAALQLIDDSKKLMAKLVSETKDPLNELIEKTQLSNQANLFSERVMMKANSISEHVLFLYDLDTDNNPPDFNFRMITWRLLLVRSLKEHMLNRLQPSQQHYEDFMVQVAGDLAEVQEVIEVNFDSALELFENADGDNDPYSIVIEAVERTITKLDNTAETVQNKQEQLKLVVIDGCREFSNKMLNLVHKGDSKQLQLLDAKYKVKQKAHGWQTKAGARWARFQDSFAVFRRFIGKKVKAYLSVARRFLGFEEQQAEQVLKTDVATYLSNTDEKIKELPYIYRRLFNFDMETDRRFYVTLNENFSYLQKAFESWENNYPSTFAVIGEKGSGKSTYLSYALDDFFKQREVKDIHLVGAISSEVEFIKLMERELDLENVDSIEGIIEAIRNEKKKKVIVLEALQNLYLRNINGYAALESLLYVISETKESIFWIVSSSLYAWNFMDKVVSISEYFSHMMRTDKLDARQIESVILSRHRSSGYELYFEPGELQSKSRAYRKIMDQEEEARKYLKDAYFEDLTNLSEGNASIAMIFWIRSIRDFDETHFYIKPLEVTSVEMIQDLRPDVLFTLASIILHDTLTPSELSKVLLFTEQESRLMLVRLKTRGLLRQDGDRYFVNQLMYRQIVRVLKERNIIHLV